MTDDKVREYLLPKRILKCGGNVDNAEFLLKENFDQASFGIVKGCSLSAKSYVLLDFGKEYSGGVKLIFNDMSGRKNANLRITFGESAMEALSNIGDKNACNDHSIRDHVFPAPWIGSLEFGNTGFRFLKIENLSDFNVEIYQVFCVFVHSKYIQTGTFSCNDEMINKVFDTAAYTVFLNMQDYVYDGVKRDRLVWIGDMHPETSSILRLFGHNGCVEKSLEFVKNTTAEGAWMNNIPSYSMWWIKILYDYYFYTGNTEFVKKQIDCVKKIAKKLCERINDDGSFNIEDTFIDWPSSTDPKGRAIGIRGLLYLSLLSAEYLLNHFDKNEKLIALISDKIIRLASVKEEFVENKQSMALFSFSKLCSPTDVVEKVLLKEPIKGVSPFLGYYVLKAYGDAGDVKDALNVLRSFWGKMIELGSTTFWEDFNIDLAKGAKPIDSILEDGEYDVHGDNGDYCYKGFRHSLCHGWSSGPAPFLSEYVLGVKVLEVGCKKLLISPDLGDLEWAEGTFPTPYGVVKVSHKKKGDKVLTKVEAPKEIELVYDNCNPAK